jgi:hypothetical protein
LQSIFRHFQLGKHLFQPINWKIPFLGVDSSADAQAELIMRPNDPRKDPTVLSSAKHSAISLRLGPSNDLEKQIEEAEYFIVLEHHVSWGIGKIF